jgi:hypothetical protein
MASHFLIYVLLWISSALNFIGNLVDNLFEPFFNVAPHGHHVDFMLDFYIEEFTFQVP